MEGDFLKQVGLDRYDLNARLRPALFVLLPVLLLVAFWLPSARTVLGGIVTLLSACGLTYLLAQTARRRGRAVERQLGVRAGRLHSARLLTHADRTFAEPTKARYYAYLAAAGVTLSTLDEELQAPAAAIDRARSAVDWLLEHTRPAAKTSLLFEENIAYGFQRNLYGMKPVGITVAILCLAINAALLWFRPLDEMQIWTGILLECGLGAILVLWLSQVSAVSVEDASLAYAQKLFSQCETGSSAKSMPAKRRRTRNQDQSPA